MEVSNRCMAGAPFIWPSSVAARISREQTVSEPGKIAGVQMKSFESIDLRSDRLSSSRAAERVGLVAAAAPNQAELARDELWRRLLAFVRGRPQNNGAQARPEHWVCCGLRDTCQDGCPSGSRAGRAWSLPAAHY